MEAKANYTIVGIVVVILTIGLISAALWLSVGFEQNKYNIYMVYINEAASGLSQDAPVKFNGVKVGYVRRIALNERDPKQVLLLLDIEEGTPITDSTTATLISQGITGTTYVGLSASTSSLKPLLRQNGQPYPVIPAKPSLFHQIDDVFHGLSENVGAVTQDIRKVFDKQNAAYIKDSLRNIKEVTSMFAKNSDTMDHIIHHADDILGSLASSNTGLPETLTAIRLSFDQLSQQTIPRFTMLVDKLNRMAANLESVSAMMRDNPSVVIRGTQPRAPGPGE